MKRILTFSLLLNFLFTSGIYAQDFDFSQWYNNPTYYNPAYVGLTAGLKARFTYRRQMVKIPASFRTYSFSADLAGRNLPGAGGSNKPGPKRVRIYSRSKNPFKVTAVDCPDGIEVVEADRRTADSSSPPRQGGASPEGRGRGALLRVRTRAHHLRR